MSRRRAVPAPPASQRKPPRMQPSPVLQSLHRHEKRTSHQPPSAEHEMGTAHSTHDANCNPMHSAMPMPTNCNLVYPPLSWPTTPGHCSMGRIAALKDLPNQNPTDTFARYGLAM